jgi:galactose mutarotase-like enzyme
MIALRAGDAVAEVVPERGALCSRLRLGGGEVLYLDPATLADAQKNVRGGIPVLFPIAGKPPEGSALKQHGFARNAQWEAVRAGEARLECHLRSGPRDGYPFAWDALLAFTLSESALRLDFTLHNTGDGAQPFQLGFHPYFSVPDKRAARVETQATQAYDNLTGATGAYAPPDFTQGEIDLHLLDHRDSGTVLHRTPAPPVRLSWSPELQRMVLWTLPEKPFICVEPWTTRGALQLAPGQTQILSFQIAIAE